MRARAAPPPISTTVAPPSRCAQASASRFNDTRLDGEYGANALRGVQYFAQRHHLTLRATRVTTASDIRGLVAGFAAEPRVRTIALSTTPAQTASAAAVNQQL